MMSNLFIYLYDVYYSLHAHRISFFCSNLVYYSKDCQMSLVTNEILKLNVYIYQPTNEPINE